MVNRHPNRHVTPLGEVMSLRDELLIRMAMIGEIEFNEHGLPTVAISGSFSH